MYLCNTYKLQCTVWKLGNFFHVEFITYPQCDNLFELVTTFFFFQETEGTLRRAHSEELLSEVGASAEPQTTSSSTSGGNGKKDGATSVSGLLQVSDHPRMRHNSADQADQDNNNYENFAHELSNSYMWPPMMTNTRDFSNAKRLDTNCSNRYNFCFGKNKKP